jgi:transposase-like protein
MTHPAYTREKARSMRVERHMAIDEIALRLALPKTTIYYWVRDLPLERRGRPNAGQRLGNERMQEKYRALREAAYAEGRELYPTLAEEPTFRDFVTLYIAEGYKRSRHMVAICNSDATVMTLAHRWMLRFAKKPLRYSFQYHADQDPAEIVAYWAAVLEIDGEAIKSCRKSNSGQLRRRTWRCVHGVLTISASDTYFRARMQAWVDCLKAEWLHSASAGRSSAW